MTGPELSFIKALLLLSSNNMNRYEGTITTYASVVNYLLRPYAMDAVVFKADESIRNSKKRLLAPEDFFQRLCNGTMTRRI